MKLLYICDSDDGGIAEYAIHQFHALGDAGAQVTFLCRPTFETARLGRRRTVLARLPAAPSRHPSVAMRLFCRIQDARAVARIAIEEASMGHHDAMLFACYREYFSPFWAHILRDAAQNGAVIGVVAHDPVRDFVLGPRWWHRWSVRQAYSFVSHVFVHDQTPVDFGGPRPRHLNTHVIPFGPFVVPPPGRKRSELRREYGFDDGDTVFLSFGQIRDGKNLDRFLRAMIHLPATVKLIVAGTSGGASQRPPEFYIQLAEELGIRQRCFWAPRYIPTAEMGDFFAAADIVLLAYSAKFRSASGVLNAAVTCRKPVLASSGPGPLQTAVESYRLGMFVPPDDNDALYDGARSLVSKLIPPAWDQYEKDNSWENNARCVIAAFNQL